MVVDQIIQENDMFRLKAKPMLGITDISAYAETLTGSTGIWQSKTFKYSIDGVNFSDLIDLTTPNITGLTFNETDFVVFEFFYTRSLGSNRTVTQLTLTETNGTFPWQSIYFDQSNYKPYFEQNDNELLNWAINVLNKVYSLNGGVIPVYLERTNDSNEDTGFVEFWRAICYFCSLDVKLARVVARYYDNEELLKVYLENRLLFFSNSNNLVTLQYLQSTYYHQIFNRGTQHILDYENSGDGVDGELIRLLSNTYKDELLFAFHKKEHFGWNLGNSSPLYRGLTINENVNKITATEQEAKVDSTLDYVFRFNISVSSGDTLTLVMWCRDRYGTTVFPKQRNDGSYSDIALDNITLQDEDQILTIVVYMYSYGTTIDVLDTTNIKQGHNLILPEETGSVTPVVSINGVDTIITNGVFFGIKQTPYSHGILQSCNWVTAYLRNISKYTFEEVKQYIRRFLISYNVTVGYTEINSIYLNSSNPLNSYVEEDYWDPVDYAIPQV